jgi:DNA-binding transcriptional MocR family regulator
LVRDLVKNSAVLLLPGTMFVPDTDHSGLRQLRIAFANIDSADISTGINSLFARLQNINI